MAKLTKLTPEQEALIPVVRDEWINRLASGAEIDREKAKEGIAWLYTLLNLKPPLTIFVDSPLAAQYAAQLIKVLFKTGTAQVEEQVEAQVGEQVWRQVGGQVWEQVRRQVGEQVWRQVGGQVGEQVGEQVWRQVGEQVWRQVGEQVWGQVRGQVREQVWEQVRGQVRGQVEAQYEAFCWYGSISDYGWVSFFDFFSRIGVLKHTKFEQFQNFIQSNVYDSIQLEGIYIACSLPSTLNRDDEHRLHSTIGPAIAWRDGYEMHYLWGVHFEKELWEKVTKKTLPVKDVLAMENMEQRMAALKIYGAEACLEGANAKLLDTSERGNKLYLLKDLFSEPQYALKYECPSTGRVYVSFVPPEVGIDGRADRAMAWKFGLEEKEYESLRIEA